MTGHDLERMGKFVQALNALEREHRVRIELTSGPDKYLRLVAESPRRTLEVVPYAGGSDLELVRPEGFE